MKMSLIDNLLIIAAGYSLFVLINATSTEYLGGINNLIPEIFSGRAMITIGEIFHLVTASLFTGLLFVRFAATPVLVALLTAIVLKAEVYILLFTSDLYTNSYSYYLTNPSDILPLLKPILILPSVTYFIGLVRFTETSSDSSNH